jgi:hypothetical protein
MIQWESRRPKAYWKGNPNVGSKIREELMKCNSSLENDSGTEIFQQVYEVHAMKFYSKEPFFLLEFNRIGKLRLRQVSRIPNFQSNVTTGKIHYCWNC